MHGHNMLICITSSEQSMLSVHLFVKVFTRHAGAWVVWGSLIPGIKYGMEQWNGKWNGMEYVQL